MVDPILEELNKGKVPPSDPITSLESRFANTRYTWAGKSTKGADCSGYACDYLESRGVKNLGGRNTSDLLGLANVTYSGKQSLQPGDVVVRRSKGPSGRHVAVYTGNDFTEFRSRGQAGPRRTNTDSWLKNGEVLAVIRPGGQATDPILAELNAGKTRQTETDPILEELNAGKTPPQSPQDARTARPGVSPTHNTPQTKQAAKLLSRYEAVNRKIDSLQSEIDASRGAVFGAALGGASLPKAAQLKKLKEERDALRKHPLIAAKNLVDLGIMSTKWSAQDLEVKRPESNVDFWKAGIDKANEAPGVLQTVRGVGEGAWEAVKSIPGAIWDQIQSVALNQARVADQMAGVPIEKQVKVPEHLEYSAQAKGLFSSVVDAIAFAGEYATPAIFFLEHKTTPEEFGGRLANAVMWGAGAKGAIEHRVAGVKKRFVEAGVPEEIVESHTPAIENLIRKEQVVSSKPPVKPTGELYHGGLRGLTVIDATAPPMRNLDNATSRFGAFATTDILEARRYAEMHGDQGQVYRVMSAPKNPYEMPWREFDALQDITRGEPDADGFRVRIPPEKWAERLTELKEMVDQRKSELVAQGYDGIIVRGSGLRPTEVVNFNNAPVRPSKPPVKPTVESKGPKEPWQMTRGEYDAFLKDKLAKQIDEYNKAGGRGLNVPGVRLGTVAERIKLGEAAGYKLPEQSDALMREDWHKLNVKAAISEGKPVPPEVLADYPDLAKKYEGPKVSTEPRPTGLDTTSKVTQEGGATPPASTKISKALENASEKRKAAFEALKQKQSQQNRAMKGKQAWARPKITKEHIDYYLAWAEETGLKGAKAVEEFLKHVEDVADSALGSVKTWKAHFDQNISIKNEDMARLRREFELGDLPASAATKQVDALNRARESGKNTGDYVRARSKDINENNDYRVLDDEEAIGIQDYVRGELIPKMRKALASSDDVTFEGLLAEFDDITKATQKSGRDQAVAFAARQFGKVRDSAEFALQQHRKQKGSALTPEETAAHLEVAETLEANKERIRELENENATYAKQLEEARKQAEADVARDRIRVSGGTRPKRDITVIRAAREDAKMRYVKARDARLEAIRNSETSELSAGLDPRKLLSDVWSKEEILAVKDIVWSYIDEGLYDVEAIVSKFKKEVDPNVDDQLVYKGISHKEPKVVKDVDAEVAQARADKKRLVSLSGKLDKLEDALRGLFKDKDIKPQDSRIENLRKQISRLRKEVGGDSTKAAMVEKLQKQLDGLNEHIARGTTPEAKQKPVVHPEVQALLDQIAEAKKTIATRDKVKALGDKLDNALNGIFDKATPKAAQNPVISNLRKQIDRLKKEMVSPQTTSAQMAKRAEVLQKKINEALRHIEEGTRPEKVKKRTNDALVEMKTTLRDLRTRMAYEDKIADLKAQIKSGEFKQPKQRRQVTDPEILALRAYNQLLRRTRDAMIEQSKPSGFFETARSYTAANRLAWAFKSMFTDLGSNILRKGTDFVVDSVATDLGNAIRGDFSFESVKNEVRAVSPQRVLAELKAHMEHGSEMDILAKTEARREIRFKNKTLDKFLGAPLRTGVRARGVADVWLLDQATAMEAYRLAKKQAQSEGYKGVELEGRIDQLLDYSEDLFNVSAQERGLRQGIQLRSAEYGLQSIQAQSNIISGWKAASERYLVSKMGDRGHAVMLMVDLIAPFPKVFANLVKYTLDYTPVGIAEAGYRFANTAMMEKTFKINSAEMAKVNMLLKRGLTGVATYLLTKNMEPPTPAYTDKETGIVDFGMMESVSVGPSRVMILNWKVTWINTKSGWTAKQKAAAIRKAYEDIVLDQPMFSGPAQFFDSHNRSEGISGFAAKQAAIIGVPFSGASGQVAETLDPKPRRTANVSQGYVDKHHVSAWEKFMLEVYNNVKKKIPVLRESLPVNNSRGGGAPKLGKRDD